MKFSRDPAGNMVIKSVEDIPSFEEFNDAMEVHYVTGQFMNTNVIMWVC